MCDKETGGTQKELLGAEGRGQGSGIEYRKGVIREKMP